MNKIVYIGESNNNLIKGKIYDVYIVTAIGYNLVTNGHYITFACKEHCLSLEKYK